MTDIEMIEQMDFPDVMLTVEQVSEQLGVSPQAVRNWEKQGKLIPKCRTEGGHRRYSQKEVTNLKKKQNDSEMIMTTSCEKILSGVKQVLSNFSPEEKVTVGIRSDNLNRCVYFTFDSEDGLQTYTKTLKMEE